MSFTSFVDSRQAERDCAYSLPFALPRMVLQRQFPLKPELCRERSFGVNEAVLNAERPLL